MTGKLVEIAFDVVCPYAYLASTQIEAIAARTRATLRWEPILLGGVFRAIGTGDDPNQVMSDAKRRHVGARRTDTNKAIELIATRRSARATSARNLRAAARYGRCQRGKLALDRLHLREELRHDSLQRLDLSEYGRTIC